MPIAIYSTYLVVIYVLLKLPGVKFNYELWHLLPLKVIMAHPLKSILLLHSQPPVLNILFWLCHAQQALLGMSPSLFATILFSACGFLSCIAWYACSLHLLRSHRMSAILVTLIVANPSLYRWESSFFYPVIELCLLGLLLWAAVGWSRQPTTRRLLLVMLVIVLIVYTRALYHPVVGVLFAALVGVHLWRRGMPRRRVLKTLTASSLFYLVLMAPWLIKNKILYGTACFSSWIGHNLIIDWETMDHSIFWDFCVRGTFNPKLVEPWYSPARLAWLKQQPATAALFKPKPAMVILWNGEPLKAVNMNHYAVPPLSSIAVHHSLRIIREHPELYLRRLMRHFVEFDLPGYYMLYQLNYKSGHYLLMYSEHGYARWFDKIYYGAWLKKSCSFNLLGFRVRPSLFLVLWMPLALGGAAWRARRLGTPEGFLNALMLSVYGWMIMMVLLVEGAESSRMRWHLEPMYLLMLGASLQGIVRRLHGPKPPSPAGANPRANREEEVSGRLASV